MPADDLYFELEDHTAFVGRHIGPDADEIAAMVEAVGASSLDDLMDKVVPEQIRSRELVDLGSPTSESEVLEQLRYLASTNERHTSLIGLGYHGTKTPTVIARNVLENPAWYTAYTPYQPEISQGRLEALINFQTMVCDLTGMELANASLLDEATAAAEAMTMALRIVKGDRGSFFVDSGCHPHTIEVVRGRAEPIGLTIIVGDPSEAYEADVFAALLQNPSTDGTIHDHTELIASLHDRGALAIVTTDLMASTLIRPPGEMGADIVVGSSQRFGVPMAFGGPHAGFLAARSDYKRTMPGRLVGASVDAEGRPAYQLVLQTREQHIRREKATSNICTAQALLAIVAGLYAAYHGPDGLTRIAKRIHKLTAIMADGLRGGGVEVVNETWFDTLRIRVPGRADEIVAQALLRGLNIWRVDEDTVSITLDETTNRGVVRDVWRSFGVKAFFDDLDLKLDSTIPADLRRTSSFLTHSVFNSHHSETSMLRYLRRLADRDLALDRTMIPLGSCTMKLNPTTAMASVTMPGFTDIHPFAPIRQAPGYMTVIRELEAMLASITGYSAVSLQPNAGSQGELAGLLAIRAYHRSKDEASRNICLIPASAHGTNAASATMAGMDVVVVACDDLGNVDLDDLRTKLDEHGPHLACIMVTYPSTHGVFEEGIVEICDLVHARGGQVYMDGANLNALIGLARPADIGADVSHLNLHKTFSIPHGGGGPGVGPVAVRNHLASFLPSHPLVRQAGPRIGNGIGPVAAAPWGSAGILPVAWAYITLMGSEGLARATRVAILNANYVARRLDAHFPVLYSGEGGFVAHECILDLRQITKDTGITVNDVAKRLADHGFHAPTISFPVPGTLMIEPTESEDKAELDRFCDAMISIRAEIGMISDGEWPGDDNPLVHAPHCAVDVATDNWTRSYSRNLAAFPPGVEPADKYWPPVGRIDPAHGDRNVFCSCL